MWRCRKRSLCHTRFHRGVTHVIVPSPPPRCRIRYMRCLLSILLLASLSVVAVAQNKSEPAIQVQLNPQKPLHLRLTLRSGAATTVKINRFDLPWGYRYSMVFAASRPNEEPVELLLPVSDPGLAEMSVKPGETLTGDIDLRNVIDQKALKKSDVLLFWAYKAPAVLHIPRWSGGLVVVPQQR